MTIEGDLADFAHLETVFLGVLSRQTKIATNVHKVVQAANSKPVLFFPSRFDHYSVQLSDGYAAHIGGIYGVSTKANGVYWGASLLAPFRMHLSLPMVETQSRPQVPSIIILTQQLTGLRWSTLTMIASLQHSKWPKRWETSCGPFA